MADQSLVFDLANRHVSTTVTAGSDTTTVTYLRDAGNRIIARTVTVNGATTDTTRYAHTASADVSGLVVDADTGAIREYTVSLPGGAAVRFVLGSNAREQWTYPNMLGSVILEADGDGVRSATVIRYDPWGQPIDPLTGRIGTATADDAVIDNAAGDADYAFVGGHRKLYEHQGSVAVVQMGARVYVPALGRFLSVDPIEGGVDNAYVYPTDPLNKLDLSGKVAFLAVFAVIAVVALVMSIPSSTVTRPSRGSSGVFPAPKPGPHASNPGTAAHTQQCNSGGCVSNEVKVSGCVLICGGVGLSFREDLKVLTNLEFGFGPELSFEIQLGSSVGAARGVSLGGSCSGAYGIGVYASGGFSTNYNFETLQREYSGGHGGGYSFGFGAGCSGGATYTNEWW